MGHGLFSISSYDLWRKLSTDYAMKSFPPQEKKIIYK